MNELQKRRVVQKLQQRLGSLRGRTVALLGLAFKPNTDDMREAPSRIIAYRLLAEGAEVRAWDPVARPDDLQGVEICDSVLEAVRDADAAVIVTEWPELRELATPRCGRRWRGRSSSTAGTFSTRRRGGRRLRVRGDRPPDPRDAWGSERHPAACATASRPPDGGAPPRRRKGGAAGRGGAGAAEAARAGRRSAAGGVRGCPARRVRRHARDRRVPRRRRGGVPRTRSPGWAPRSRRWGRRSRSAAAAASGSRPRGGRRRGRCSPSTATSFSTSTSRALLSEHEASGAAGDDRRRAGPLAVRRRRGRGGRDGHRLPRGAAARALGQLRRLRARRGRARAPAGEGRPRAVDLPAARRRSDRLHAHRHEGVWLTVNTPKDLRRAAEFIEEHPELAAAEAARLMLDSPNYGSLDRFAFEPRRVEKPWGWELIWAHADAYVGKILFVRAGESLSLQFHREKDESWYVAERPRAARARRGRPGGARRGGRHGRRVLPLSARHRAPRHGARGHDDPRGLDAASRRRRPARGPLRTRRHQRRLSGSCAGTGASTSATSAGCRSPAAARPRTASSCAPTGSRD